MRNHPHRGALATLLAVLLALPAACTETPTSPPAPASTAVLAMSVVGASDFSPVPLQLRPGEGSELRAWGELTVFVGSLVPPNPCLHAVQDPTLIVCGVIQNPDAQLLTAGTLIVQATREGPRVQIDFAVPPNPCLTYLVSGAAAADLGTGALLELPAVQAVFTFERGFLVSAHPGGVNVPEGGGRTTGDTQAPPNPCVIDIATHRAP